MSVFDLTSTAYPKRNPKHNIHGEVHGEAFYQGGDELHKHSNK